MLLTFNLVIFKFSMQRIKFVPRHTKSYMIAIWPTPVSGLPLSSEEVSCLGTEMSDIVLYGYSEDLTILFR